MSGRNWIIALAAVHLAATPPTAVRAQQQIDLAAVIEALERDGRFEFQRGNVMAVRYDFPVDGVNVEAIVFRPIAEGKRPGLMLIPGFGRTARDYIPMGLRFAREGFACVAVTQRGFGKSGGEPDFVGPKTIAALEAAFHRFRKEEFVDAERMGVLGYSRGAMAASLLASRLKPGELHAAVFAAGIYDFKKAYDEIRIEGIRRNMELEAGLDERAVELRSSIRRIENVECPILILHGEKDQNAPVGQAYLLRDRLRELNLKFEIEIFTDREHDIGRQNLNDHSTRFFKGRLMPQQAPAAEASKRPAA